MYRVSSNMSNDDFRYRMLRQDNGISQLENKISSSNRITNLRDDPVAAAHSTRLKSNITRMERFERNIDYTKGRYNEVEGYMDETLNILHRLRELAVQGSNGTYGEEDREMMAVETNELLNQLVTVANTTSVDGRALFGGTDREGEPFEAFSSRIPKMQQPGITQVTYLGNIQENQVEIAEGSYVPVDFRGNDIFWSEHNQLFGPRDVQDYVVQEDTAFTVDGVTVNLKAGDNINNIVDRINGSTAAVKAEIDPVSGALNMKTTVAHQIWLDEPENATVLKDLGLITAVGKPPMNLGTDVASSGGSLFDTIINMRDSLLNNDAEQVGGSVLAGLSSSMDTLLGKIADLGAMEERLDVTQNRLSKGVVDTQAWDSSLTDTDMTEAVTRLKMMEFVQQATYRASSQIWDKSLMDFLR
ncbi:MAG: flagellar hook-associated protein 3 [Spirochaetales bacterium]|nr:flagellar hook-associated protein 3 [Spirochaetales bacterium]